MDKKLNKPLFALRLAGWLLIGLVTLELCARTEDRVRYGAPFFGNYSMDELFTYDALGKWGRPHSEYLKWHLNDLGFRGPALRNGTYRIACFGSSETFGLYESEHNEWPRQLEHMLNQRTRTNPYEVVDVAYPGLSLGTTLLRIPQILSELHPNLVVIYPSYTPYVDRATPQAWPAPPPTPTRAPAERPEPRIAGKFSTLLKTALPNALQTWIRARQIKSQERGLEIHDHIPQQNVDAFQTDLDNVVTQLQQHGVQVILVTHANRFGKTLTPEDRDFLVSWRKFFPSLTESGLLDMEARMSQAVIEEGGRRNIPVVDAAHNIAPGSGNFAEFVHFTDNGSRALAGLVANQITAEQQQGTLPVPSRPDSQLATAPAASGR